MYISRYERKQKLIKKIQELYSWSFFYTNSPNELQYSRYPRTSKTVLNRNTGENIKVSVSPYLEYSKRFKEDKEKAHKLEAEIQQNQLKLKQLKTKK